MSQLYDIAVIGGGPGGYSAAIKAAQLGAKVAVFEKDTLGGTCLNVGCIPTKCLLEKAAFIEKIKKNTQNGLFKEAGLYSWKKIQEQKEATVKKLTGGVGSILLSYGIDVVKGTAVVTESGKISVDGQNYHADKIIIATGSSVFIPPVKGVQGRHVLTSAEALSLQSVPEKLIIIGGGVIGLEFSSIYNTFGTEVVVIEMLEDIVAGEDKEAAAILKKELANRGIQFITGARVEAIHDHQDTMEVTYLKNNKESVCSAEYVLMAVGRKPNTEEIKLEGLLLDSHGNIVVNSKLETNIPDVYAVGDVTGGFQLAHAAYAEAEIAAENCMGMNKEVDLRVMPRCIYCMPQLAAVGKTEEQLLSEGAAYSKASFPYGANGKALASDEPDGTVKILTDTADGTILGVHIVGGYATELLSAALVAIHMHAAVADFEQMIFPHPTMSELIKEAVLATKNKALHIPKTK